MKEILIVDDEKIFRGHLRRELQDRGFVTHEAASVDEAIEMLAVTPQIQVVLLDLEFKTDPATDRRRSMDGTHVLESIKDRSDQYRVIVYTGHEEYLDYSKAKAYGIFSYLPKGNADLVEAITFEVEKAFWDIERASFEKHFNIQKKITSDAPLESVLDLVCKSALQSIGGYTCHIRLLDLQMGDFPLAASKGPFPNVKEIFRGRTTINDMFSGRVARTGKLENIGDLQNDPDFQQMRRDRLAKGNVSAAVNKYLNSVRSAYIVPISTKIFENKVDAVLNISSTSPNFFTQRRCQLVDEFKTQAEIAITKVWLHRRKKEAQEDYGKCNELLVSISAQLQRQTREQLQAKQVSEAQKIGLERIYDIVVTGVSNIVNAEMISIFLFDQVSQQLTNVYEYRGNARIDDSDEVFAPGESLTGTVFKDGKAIRIPSQQNPWRPTEDKRYDASREQINLEKIPSHQIEHYLCVPLKIGETAIGVIRAVNKKSGYYEEYFEDVKEKPDGATPPEGDTSISCLLDRGFSQDCETTLEIIASHLGVAIQNSELVNRLSWKIAQLEILTEVARRISSDSEADIDKLLWLIVSKTAEVMHAEVCMLFLKDEKENAVNLRECYGMPMIPGAFYELGEGKTGLVAKTGLPLIEPVADQEHMGKYSNKVIPFLKPDADGVKEIRSFMAVPIIALERSADKSVRPDTIDVPKAPSKTIKRGAERNGLVNESPLERENIIGVLKVYNKTEDNFQFNEDDLSIFLTFASQVGVVLALAERNNSLSHLVRGVCHEIRNKAGMIPPNVSMIREDLAGESNLIRREAISGKLDLIEKAASQALEFARDLLGFSDSHFKVREDLDINELIQEAVEQLADTSATIRAAQHVKLELDGIGKQPLLCSVFRTPFIHIIQNIVMNAYEAMDEVKPSTLSITTRTDSSSKIAYISISDTGKGISEEDLPQIFDATFFRRKGGNGLGLWIVRNYLSRMDGIISVKSQLNYGTTISIQLPTVEAKSERLPWNKFVLIIEDDPLPAETVRNIITSIGYEYIMVDDGEQAMSRIQHDSYDLIILDIGLGAVNGLDLLREAKALGRELPPVIVITGHEGHEREARMLGVFEFLRKDPLSLDKLRDAVLRATSSPN